MIVVTGATGKLGRRIVEALLTRAPTEPLGVSVRDPDKAADLAARGVRVRRGDFDDPASLVEAFEGARQVLMVSSNARAYGGDTLAQHAVAIAAASEAAVGRVVYTSHMGASANSAFPPMLDHAATEALLNRSGLRWLALRNGFYAESGVALMGDVAASGVIRAPADGKVSWTAHVDLAEAAAALVTQDVGEDGPTAPLTGAVALDLSDMAAIAGDLLGRPVRRDEISDDQVRAGMAARGAPPQAAAMVLGLNAASRAGEFARVDPTLGRLIGRRPTSFRVVLAEALGLPA